MNKINTKSTTNCDTDNEQRIREHQEAHLPEFTFKDISSKCEDCHSAIEVGFETDNDDFPRLLCENPECDMHNVWGSISFKTINVDGNEISRSFETILEMKDDWWDRDGTTLPSCDDKLISANVDGEKFYGSTFEDLINYLSKRFGFFGAET